MLIDEFNKANIEAMKSRDMVTKNIIGIIKNKYMLLSIEKKAQGKAADDADLIAIIQKTSKELAEESENYLKASNKAASDDALKQKAFIEKYLPSMLSESEIKQIILSQPDRSVPAIMKLFKAEYAGKCDMRMVGDVLKTI